MRFKGILITLIATAAMLGQAGRGRIEERIQNAPLTPGERQAVSAAFSAKEYARLEGVLATVPSDMSKVRVGARLALLGALEFLSGRMSQAAQAFERADGLSPLGDHDRFTLAMALVDLGNIPDSRTQLTHLNESHPDQPIYLYWLGRLDYGQRLYDDSVAKFKKVVGMDPSSVRGYDNLGLSYDMMGLTEQAQAAFGKAVVLNRQLAAPSPWPPHNLGYLQLRLQHFVDAEASLREALTYDSKFAMAHYHLARVLEKEDRSDAAIEEYKTAAALDSKLAEPLYSLVLLYRRRGQDADAANALAEYRRRRAAAGDSQ